jgi:glycosyltransferase involved in cell wall biosynthesis
MEGHRGLVGAPALSIVVPVYRVEEYLEECLDSILGQEGADDVEVIAVDDGSTDACGSMLAEYARQHPRVRVVQLPRNRGLSEARNVGLDHARGTYVWFVDADDWLPPGSLLAVAERLRGGDTDVLILEHAVVYEDGSSALRVFPRVWEGLAAPIRLADRPELLRLAQSACTKVVRRDFLLRTGLRFLPGWYEDTSFSHPLLMAASRIDLLGRVCYCYRQRPQGITRTVSHRHFEVFDQYRRLFEMVDGAGGAYEVFRPELFRLMVNHYLVILGNDSRLPEPMRRSFFDRVVAEYRRLRPPGGYPVPGGSAGVKHRLVRHQAYRAYTALRLANDGLQRARRALVPRWVRARLAPDPTLLRRPEPAPRRAGGPHPVGLIRPRSAVEPPAFVDESS